MARGGPWRRSEEWTLGRPRSSPAVMSPAAHGRQVPSATPQTRFHAPSGAPGGGRGSRQDASCPGPGTGLAPPQLSTLQAGRAEGPPIPPPPPSTAFSLQQLPLRHPHLPPPHAPASGPVLPTSAGMATGRGGCRRPRMLLPSPRGRPTPLSASLFTGRKGSLTLPSTAAFGTGHH